MAAFSPSTTVVATQDHISSTLSGEEVILDLTEGAYYGLNEVGTVVWQRLATPQRVEALCDAVEAEYDVTRDVLMADLKVLLADLLDRNLIRVVAA
jgi:hypothetical protein